MKRQTIRMTTAIAAVLVVLSCSVQAGSIWAKRGANAKPLYADDKANKIGDLVTVIISEDHKVDNKVKRDLARSTSQSLGFNNDDISIGGFSPVPDMNVSTGSDKSLSGKSDYKDERTIEDLVTAVVEDVHPNGNLVVIGNRKREVNGDTQIIQVSGIIRPSDISYNNVVYSNQIANFQLVALSEGATEAYTKPGWLGKLLNAIWPF